MKRLLLITLTIAATLLAMFLLWFFGPVLAIFGASLAISAALRPLVARLEARGLGRGLAILAWYLLILAALVGGLSLYGLALASSIPRAQLAVPAYYNAQIDAWMHGSNLERALANALPRNFTSFLNGMSSPEVQGTSVSDLLNGVINLLVFLLGALSLAFYWLMEVTRFERLWLSLLPVGTRIHARDIWRHAERVVGAYIRSSVSAIVVAIVLLYMFYTLLGIPGAATLAIFGGLSHLLPRIGPIIGLLPAVLVALTYSPTIAVGALIIGGVVQIAVHHITEYLMRTEEVRVNPLLQVLLLLALATLGGLPLMLFAPPLAALIQTLYPSLLMLSSTQQRQSAALELLYERLQALQAAVPSDNLELTSALKRSDSLLEQARSILKE